MIKLLYKYIRRRLTRTKLPYFPFVRRVNYQLIAQELIKVEPMPLPKGLLFYVDFTKEQDAKTITEQDTKVDKKV